MGIVKNKIRLQELKKDKPEGKDFAVYYHVGTMNEVLYVGYSADILTRTATHRVSSAWFKDVVRIDVSWFGRSFEALTFEANEINRLQPPFNKRKQCRPPKGKTFLDEIEAFLEKTGIDERVFGRLSAKNPRLVENLRNSKAIMSTTQDKVRDWMRANKNEIRMFLKQLKSLERDQ